MTEKAGNAVPTGSDKPAGTAPAASPAVAAEAKPPPKGNPAFRAMGLPYIRMRLPSRRWMIFLSIVGSWTAAIVYDRREKKKVQKKWCTLVEHIAQESLPTNSIARRVTIVLAAPPGDSVRPAREYFLEYVKPVLASGALDWDVIEGRREGEVRVGLAERIRKLRKRAGESTETPLDWSSDLAVEANRVRNGIQDFGGEKGDIVIGRHTWKEYVRGLHEGWLGPLDPPKQQQKEHPASSTSSPAPTSSQGPDDSGPLASTTIADNNEGSNTADASPTAALSAVPDAKKKPEKEKDKKQEKGKDGKPKREPVPPAFNTPSSYPSSPLPNSIPSRFTASDPVIFPHLLGIRYTPIRIYRYLRKRVLADEVGRQVAAAVLAAHRPYHESSAPENESRDDTDESSSGSTLHATSSARWEQEEVLKEEEPGWYKTARKRVEGEGERVWLDDMVLDPRIAARMRKFELEPEEEERARRIGQGVAGIPGRRAGDQEGAEEDMSV